MTGATPTNFGAEYSGSVIGVQMAFAYCGMTFTPILFGKLAEATTIRLLPFGVALLAGLVLLFTELLNRSVAKRKAADKLRQLPLFPQRKRRYLLVSLEDEQDKPPWRFVGIFCRNP